jgi:RNA polymerase sigma factor (sigma-70 family)
MNDHGIQQTPSGPSDIILIERILQGSRIDLEALLMRYQAWIYNVALKMTLSVQDAEDITQEILIKLVTKLSTFDSGKAAFRTWLYRIVANHVLNMRKSRYENLFASFDASAEAMEKIPDQSIGSSPEVLVLVEELKIKCLTGLLLCLDRKQRFIFIMSEIFDVGNPEGAAIMAVSQDNYRQMRSRGRRKVYQFINRNCGLIHPDNPCHCPAKVKSLIHQGFVDPHDLVFYKDKVKSIEDALSRNRGELEQAYSSESAQKLFRNHPFYDPPDFRKMLGRILSADLVRLFNG